MTRRFPSLHVCHSANCHGACRCRYWAGRGWPGGGRGRTPGSSPMEEQSSGFHAAVGAGASAIFRGQVPGSSGQLPQKPDCAAQIPNMEKRRRFPETSIADASVAVAQEYIKAGRYDEAVKLLEDALEIHSGPCLGQAHVGNSPRPGAYESGIVSGTRKNVEGSQPSASPGFRLL